MIKSVAAVQKLSGTGLRLNLIQYQPTLSTSIMKNSFSTTRTELNKDTDGLGNKLKEGVPFKSYVKNSENLDHFTQSQSPRSTESSDDSYMMPHPIWSKEETENIQITHRSPKGFVDWAAYASVSALRFSFDLFSGYTRKNWMDSMDEKAVLARCIFLETVAGVPGFAAGMIRHLNSLRKMERDHGWIHTLIEEAENERMHLMTFLQLRRPGPFFRGSVIVTQFMFTAGFSLMYLISPHFCHRFVGYLEEQAVVTYTDILTKLDEGKLPMWRQLKAPEIAVKYWKLGDDAMMRDVVLAIRADEAHHRVVNHKLGDLDLKEKNPFRHHPNDLSHFKETEKSGK